MVSTWIPGSGPGQAPDQVGDDDWRFFTRPTRSFRPPCCCLIDRETVQTGHQFDHNSGPGTQFEVSDVDGDGHVDVITSNKKGVHLFLQRRE